MVRKSSIVTFVEIDEGTIVEVGGDSDNLLGMPMKSLIGQSFESLQQEIESRLGTFVVRYVEERPDRQERWLDLRSPGAFVTLRSVTIPTGQKGRRPATKRLVAWEIYSPHQIRVAQKDAAAQLRQWSGHDDALFLEFFDEICSTKGRSEPWLGIAPGEFEGKSMPQVTEVIQSHLGTIKYELLNRTPLWDDVLLEFETPEGLQSARAIVMPCVNDQEEIVGRLHLVAASGEFTSSRDNQVTGELAR